MPASEAQIAANRANAAKSTGPKTEEGKERSRANALKHGMTGAGLVLPELAAVEAERRYEAFLVELNPSGELGVALVRQIATMSVRMESCAEQQTASQAARVRRALLEFEAPEGADEAEVDRLRAQAVAIALFDPSREACLARRYEAAAGRNFFRALKELRQVEKAARLEEQAQAAEEDRQEELASFLEMDELGAEFDALYPEPGPSHPRKANGGVAPRSVSRFDVPLTIGRRR